MKSIAIYYLFFSVIFLSALPPGEEENVVSVVQHFFIVTESRNIKEAQKLLLSEGFTFSINQEGRTNNFQISNLEEYINSLPRSKERHREEMYNPKVLVQKNIAVLWTDYYFYTNGKFSHCGIKTFNLIKTENGWKIVSLVWTIEKNNCLKKKEKQ